jgi:nicotinamidase/pyrazinamidase
MGGAHGAPPGRNVDADDSGEAAEAERYTGARLWTLMSVRTGTGRVTHRSRRLPTESGFAMILSRSGSSGRMHRMHNVVFWDEDTQYDFMYPDGKLYVEGAEEIIPNLERLTRCAREQRVQIVDIMCDHTETDAEISTQPDFQATFPPHCLRGTPGQRLIDATAPLRPLYFESRPYARAEVAALLRAHSGEIVIKKQTLDPFSNPALQWVLDVLDPQIVVVYGVTTDCCVDEAVRGLRERGRRVLVVDDAIKEIDAARAQRCTAQWRAAGVELVTTADIITQRVVRLGAT